MAAIPDTAPRALEETVHQPNHHSRTALARRLLDVLTLPDGRMTANERAFAGDILTELVSLIDQPLRREVAERLAATASAPPILLRRLLLDEPSVAAPLIRSLTDIPDSLLIEAVGASHRHREMLVAREGISDAVAEALLERDEAPITKAVLALEGVTLSLRRVEALVQKSRHDVETRRLLLSRPELQPSHGFSMFWWCDSAARKAILRRFSLDRSVIQDTLKPIFVEVFPDPAADPVTRKLLTLVDRRHRPRGKNGEAVGLDVVARTLAAARLQSTPELCHAVGLVAGVSAETATRVLLDPGGEPYAIMAKSVGLSRATFFAILEDTQSDMPGGASHDSLAETFDMVARDFSRAVLRYWDWRPKSVAPALTTYDLEAPQPTGDAYLGAL